VLINANWSHNRGVWRISNRWHLQVSDGQAFDPVCRAQAAIQHLLRRQQLAAVDDLCSGRFEASPHGAAPEG
jgi:hypothetical protein